MYSICQTDLEGNKKITDVLSSKDKFLETIVTNLEKIYSVTVLHKLSPLDVNTEKYPIGYYILYNDDNILLVEKCMHVTPGYLYNSTKYSVNIKSEYELIKFEADRDDTTISDETSETEEYSTERSETDMINDEMDINSNYDCLNFNLESIYSKPKIYVCTSDVPNRNSLVQKLINTTGSSDTDMLIITSKSSEYFKGIYPMATILRICNKEILKEYKLKASLILLDDCLLDTHFKDPEVNKLLFEIFLNNTPLIITSSYMLQMSTEIQINMDHYFFGIQEMSSWELMVKYYGSFFVMFKEFADNFVEYYYGTYLILPYIVISNRIVAKHNSELSVYENSLLIL